MVLSVESVGSTRAQLWDAGFRPVPILNFDARVPSPGKQPIGDGWREAALRDPPQCLTFPPVAHALNTGLLCDGLRPIDLDIDDDMLAKRIRAMAADRFGECPVRVRRNSSRCLMLYRAADGAPPKIAITGAAHSKTSGCKVEVLGAGQQFVAFGRHDSGADLEWFPEPPGEATLHSLPAITEAEVHAFLTDIAPLLGANPPGYTNGHDRHEAGQPQAEPLRLAAALANIPNTGAPDWEWWNKVGMALFRATDGSAIGGELWNEWSKRNPAYQETEAEERWRHYRRSPPTELGAGTLFHLAGNTFQPERTVEEPPEWLDAPPPHENWESVETEAISYTEPPDETDPELIPFPATPVSAAKLETIPPRELVYGHFLFRRFVSALGAPGGSGKTAYAFVVALAICIGRDLLSEGVYDPGNAWIYNLEDPDTELYRRLKAAMIGHNVSFGDIEDRIFMDSGRDRPLVIARAMRDGTVIAWPQVPALIAEIKARNVHLLVVDPFVRSHRVEENHNDQIDFVAALWASIADASDCSILLVHHFKKGGVSGDAGAFRGASALIDASRAAVTLSTMATEEASRLGIPEKERWQYVRVDNAKLNLAPPPDDALWLKLSGVSLDNATDTRQADNVQTVQRWEPPSPWAEFPMSMVTRILDRLTKGPGNSEQYYLTGGTSERWAGQVVMAESGKTVDQAKAIIAAWKRSGLIEPAEYPNPKDKGKTKQGMTVNQAKVSEMIRDSEDRFTG